MSTVLPIALGDRQELGLVQPRWRLELLTGFRDRFVLGADEFYGIEGKTPERSPSTTATWALLDQLPADLAQKIACDNVRAVYRIE